MVIKGDTRSLDSGSYKINDLEEGRPYCDMGVSMNEGAQPLEGLGTCCRAIPAYMGFHVSLGQGNPKFWTLVRRPITVGVPAA